MIRRRSTALAALVVVAAFSLTGCFASPDGSDTAAGGAQSTAAACTVVSDSVDEAIGQFDDLDTTDDPQTLSNAMNAAADAIGDAVGEIDNSDVEQAAQDVQAAYEQIAELTASMASGEEASAEDSEAFATEYQEALTTFAELCGAQN